MKKLLTSALAVLMTASLVGCSSSSSSTTSSETESNGYTGPTELTVATNKEVQTLDYNITALATDHELSANFVDGLLEIDNYGKLVGDLAESYEANEDATEWTFHIRKGVKWVTNSGEEYDEVKAQDFVTGVRHGAEFESGTAWLLQGVVVGYSEYMSKKDFSDEAWEKVGVKATDDYTLVFTLETSTPYFASMTTYAVVYPINESFLTSKGTGCALGAPDKENCSYGTAAADSILYNGAYLLSVYDSKSQTVLVANDSYWDSEHVYLKKVTRIYDDGSDTYSSIKGFENGTYASASLNPTWVDYSDYATKYADNAISEEPNASVFGVVFNYNRQIYDNTAHTTDEEKTNTYNAIQNENFRKAVRAAYDKLAYLMVSAPEEVATGTLRNINNYPTVVTTTDGRSYGDLVQAAYTADTGEDRSLADGVDAFFSKDDCLEYIEAAKAEGIQFPVSLDMLVIESGDTYVKRGQSIKQSIEENSDGNIIINLIMRDQDTVQAIAYYNTDPAGADYDISTFTGWSPDYNDPKSFVDIYSPVTGYYMTSCGLIAGEDTADQDIKDKVGFDKYEELYRAADAITDDLDARYEAFAKADAYLIEHALFVPTSQQSRFQIVTHVVPFTSPYSQTGLSEYKYKYRQLQEDIVTVDQYNSAKEAWEAARAQ